MILSNSERIIFFGTGGRFSLLSLKTLLETGFDVCLIVKATSAKLSIRNIIGTTIRVLYRLLAYVIPSLTKKAETIGSLAAKHGIPILEVVDKLDLKFQQEIRGYNPDLVCIASFNQLVGKEIIQIPKYGIINFHPSLLPYYPGPDPWFKMIMNNEIEWGATIHYIDEGEDSGDIIYQSKIDYSEADNGKVLYNKVVEIGAELMAKAVRDIFNGEVRSYPQPEVADRLRSPRPEFDDLIITLKPTAEQTYYFLNRLLFFVNPVIRWRNGYYRVKKIAKYSPKIMRKIPNRDIEVSRRLVSSVLECCFNDGLIKLKVARIRHE